MITVFCEMPEHEALISSEYPVAWGLATFAWIYIPFRPQILRLSENNF
jgi:hypothetical protein